MSGTAEQGFAEPTYAPRQRSNSFGGSGSTRALHPEGLRQENKPEKLQSGDHTDINGNVVVSVSGSQKGSMGSRVGSTNSMNRSLQNCFLKQTSFASLDHEDEDIKFSVPEPQKNIEPEVQETQWDSKFQYLLALLGWAVGLGNIWRFPYLCYKHGGGAFLIPYLLMLVFEAFPLFFMELLLGQRHRVGSVSLWKKFEYRATGIGCASAIVCVLISLYYNVILSWALYYLYNSFSVKLPWSECPLDSNGTMIKECSETSATEYFYYRKTLDFAGWGSDDSVKIVWPILLCNTLLWAVIFFACVKGISSAGKAMYVTVIFPIVILFIFFIRSMTLTGAGPGIQYLFKPDVQKIFTKGCWQDAATQTFFNLGLAYGTVISYSSFNPQKNNCQQDALFVATINAIVSVIASVTVFGIIGFKSLLSSSSCFQNYLQNQQSPEINSFLDQNSINIRNALIVS